MRHWHTMLLAALTLVGCVVSGSAQSDPPPPTRTITVTVTVEAPTGTPIQGLTVCLACSQPPAVGHTDAAGHVTLTGTFPEGVTKVYAFLTRQSSALVQQGSAAEWTAFDNAIAAHAFAAMYPIPIDSASSYSVAITGRASIAITGTLMGNVAGVRYGILYPDQPVTDFLFETNAPFELKGVPQGAEIDFQIVVRGRQLIKVIHLDANQTMSSVDLGSIAVPEATTGRRADIVMLNGASVGGTPEAPYPRNGEVRLVRADGVVVYGAAVRPTGDLVTREHSDGRLRLPPGIYYISPGPMLTADMPSTRLYRLLMAGRVADVEAAHDPAVPKIVVPDDGATDPLVFSFDAVQAEAAIRGIP